MDDVENTGMSKEELIEKVEKFFEAIKDDKDRLYLICTKGIGDFFIVGGFSEAVQKRKNKKSTVLVINRSKRNTGLFFPNVSGIMSCNGNIMTALDDYFHETKNYEGENYIYAHNRRENNIPVWDQSLNMIGRLKKNALGLPLDAPFVYPFIEEVSKEEIAALHKKYILNKNRTIILLPHAITFGKMALNEEFWVKMAKRLKEKNYIVYTNVAGEEQPIEGTEPFNVTLPEIYYLTNKVKCFIGLRSGIFDFLAITDAKMITVNVFPNWFWDISIMYPNCDNHTFYDTSDFIKNVNKLFEEYGVSIKMNFSQKVIPQKDVFYSTDDILEAILKEVAKIKLKIF